MVNRPDGASTSYAVVTGGAGFLGSHLCEALLESGHYVTCIDNFETGRKANVRDLGLEPRFQVVQCDITEGIDLDGPVDIVYHFATPASPSDYLLDPVGTMKVASLGTLHALDLARSRSARFVLASTSEVYGPPGPEPSREDHVGQLDPVDVYGAYYESRRFAESLTATYRTAYNVKTAIARIFSTYGPRMRLDDGRIVAHFIRQALTGAPLTVPGSGTQTRSLCFVGDAIAGIMALANAPYSGPVNIGSPDEVSVLAVAHEVMEIVGPDAELVFVDAPTNTTPARQPDIALADELLDWQPHTSMKVGLASTVAWFRQAGVNHG